MNYLPPIDSERLLIAHLKTDLDLYDVTDGRIVTKLPSTFAGEACVLLMLDGGGPVDVFSEWVDRPIFTVHTYGPSKHQAREVMDRFLVALRRAVGAPHELGVVTETGRITDPLPIEDPQTDYEGYSVVVYVVDHPFHE